MMSLLDHLDAKQSGRTRPKGPPQRAEILTPDHPLWSKLGHLVKVPATAPEAVPSIEPTAQDFDDARAGRPVKVKTGEHARRLMRAREILKERGEL